MKFTLAEERGLVWEFTDAAIKAFPFGNAALRTAVKTVLLLEGRNAIYPAVAEAPGLPAVNVQGLAPKE